MLILTRKKDESIRIGEIMQVKVLEIEGNQVRLGITAPKEVIVDREEVYQQKKAAKAD